MNATKNPPSRRQKESSKQILIRRPCFHYFYLWKSLFLYLRIAPLGYTPKLTVPKRATIRAQPAGPMAFPGGCRPFMNKVARPASFYRREFHE